MPEREASEEALLRAVAARRAAAWTPHDDRVEWWLGAMSIVVILVLLLGAISWLIAGV